MRLPRGKDDGRRPVRPHRQNDRTVRKAQVHRRGQGGAPCRPACSLYAGRHGTDVSADPERHEDACRADGRFLVRAQACHADCGFVRHARGKRVPHLRQGRADSSRQSQTQTPSSSTRPARSPTPRRRSRTSSPLPITKKKTCCVLPRAWKSTTRTRWQTPWSRTAKERGLSHEEYHSQVQYIVAHGISSMVEGKKVIIGSAHFVFEDEGCTCACRATRRNSGPCPRQYSHLYLCIAGKLAAVICIYDPLRNEAAGCRARAA